MSNWKHKELTNDELKQLVRDVYDQKIFTSLQCDSSNMSMIFMPSMFMGVGPIEPSLVENNQINRKNKLQYIEDKLIHEKETPEREEYMKNIGMVYEYMDKAGPRSVNGYPCFMSMQIVSYDDAQRFVEKYNSYVKKRKEFEDEF